MTAANQVSVDGWQAWRVTRIGKKLKDLRNECIEKSFEDDPLP
ncbi:MAG: hypothetical protein WCK41_05775 [Actinomycetes bacterium]